MLSICKNFQVFGDGTDKMILMADGQGYVINHPVLYAMTISHNVHEFDTGDMFKHYSAGLMTADLHFKSGEIKTISYADYDPLMQKSVLELMQAVNKKLRARS